jgi:peptidoglycan/xylan/chitin deacetylase (PgdA/CDA1 family)
MVLRSALRAAQALLPRRSKHWVILAYHLVEAGTDSPVDLPLEAFDAQLDELSQGAVVASLEAGLGLLAGEGGKPLGRRPLVSLTFDDAYENFYRVVWPRLAERALSATLFVPVAFVDGNSGPPIRGTDQLPPATWAMLREMTDSGLVRIGSHSWSHADTRRLSDADLEQELARSREHLEDRLGQSVPAFCYPRGLWNRRVEHRVAESYDFAVVGGGRAITPGNARPHRLWRTPIRRDAPTALHRLLRARVWLEELAADAIRRLR